jgi:hypothetical protein
MKKTLLLFVFAAFGMMAYGQVTFTGVNWVNWANEPDYEGVVGYSDNPYDNPEYTAVAAPAEWAPVTDVASFDATWDLLGNPQNIANPTEVQGGNLFDLGNGNTFGAQWQAVHDGNVLYILLKYWDTNNQSATPLSFEVMAQPASPVRHEPTYDAGVAAEDMAQRNMAYGRYVELGGGKALFRDGEVTEYAASVGLTGNWGANEPGLAAFLELDNLMFWSDEDGVIRAVLPMDFAGVLSHPEDPADMDGTRIPVAPGDVIAFDVKSNARVGGNQDEHRVEYFWAADRNNGYASNYYSGHMTIGEADDPPPADVVFTGVNWVNWANEPDYDGVTGYAENPYDNPEYTVYMINEWQSISTVESFDQVWEWLPAPENIANPTEVQGGDLFDLDNGATFGAQWKAIHDGSVLYVLLKYWDTNDQSATPLSFEVMAQPASPVRHEPTYDAGVAADDMAKKNMAYGRYVELGGGKALFRDGEVTEYAASVGLTGNWGANEPGLAAFLELDDLMFWSDEDGVIRAVLPMDFDGVLSYPNNPEEMDGTRTGLSVGDVFAFDVKSNARVGGDQNEHRVEYFWAADRNNGYASNYYSGHLTISPTIWTSSPLIPGRTEISLPRVYAAHGTLYVRGSEPVSLDIYNVVGSRVKTVQNVLEVSLGDLDSGVYIVRIKGDPQAVKIIKY